MTLSPGPYLTVKDVLSLPDPQPPLANPSTTRAAWPASTFTFGRGSNAASRTDKSIYLVDPLTPTSSAPTEPTQLLDGLTRLDLAWIDDSTLAFLRPVRNDLGSTDDKRVDHPQDVGDEALDALEKEWAAKPDGKGTEVWALDVETKDEYKLGSLPGPIANLKSVPSGPSTVLLAFSSLVYSDGSLFTVASQDDEADKNQAGSDIMVYDSLPVRHWDHWCPTRGQRQQVHVVRIVKGQDRGKRGWALETDESKGDKRVKVLSPMAGTEFECPVGPFGSSADFTLSATHLAFHSKDPALPRAWHTRTNVYVVPLLFSSGSTSEEDSMPHIVSSGSQGASASPAFNREGTRLAWLEMRQDGYEADRNRVMVYDLEKRETTGVTEEWDRSPASVRWSRDGKDLLLLAEDQARVKLFQLALGDEGKDEKKPVALTEKHSVLGATSLADGRVLVASSSFTSPMELSILSTPTDSSRPTLSPLSSLTRSRLASKSLDAGEEFWFESGAAGQKVHGWIFFPPSRSASSRSSGTDEKEEKKYPLALLSHGGPQTSVHDEWSTRWNMNVHAAKGYATVAINRTGSTGFGQAFCDAIQNDWAGQPFRDIVNGIEYVKKTYPQVDPDRMGSYAGFMQNWIQGHNDQLRFKCLVNFQGSTSTGWYATEELYFFEREFGGKPWEVPQNYDKWNPQAHIDKWKTPEMVIHTSKDYRIPESEGLGVFNTLQRLGIPSRLVVFPSENHWDLTPQNNVRWHEEVFRWIGQWTNTKDEC
ncbi:hypothetical protein JCM10212_001324 [Sporobolomyces blumeae]